MYGHTDIEFRVNHDSKLPLYYQVEQLIRGLIKQHEYQNGALLPKELDLATRLSVSRSTIRQALQNLVNEGLLERKKGVGTRVAHQKRTVSRLENWLSFTREMNAKGLEVVNYELAVSLVRADQEVANALSIPLNKEVVLLSRLRGSHEAPALITLSWFHPRIGFTTKVDFQKPLYELLDKEYHTVVEYSQEEIKAEKCTAEQARKLQINEGDPILSRYRVVSDAGRRPVEFNKTYYRADSYSYFIELQRNGYAK